jgi:hypothetical protein
VARLYVGGCLVAAATYLHCVTVRSARLWPLRHRLRGKVS